jgi:hypothetical protein
MLKLTRETANILTLLGATLLFVSALLLAHVAGQIGGPPSPETSAAVGRRGCMLITDEAMRAECLEKVNRGNALP